DKPYVHSTPASAPSALAVAQTNVPAAFQSVLEVIAPAGLTGQYAAVYQPWSAPFTATLESAVQIGDGSNGNLNGCAPFLPGSLIGKIVLVERGSCPFTLKVKHIGEGGATAALINLTAPGEPLIGGDGGQRPLTIPAFSISQVDATLIKQGVGDGIMLRFDPSHNRPLVGHLVGSSSRGPAPYSNLIKPDIAAPGAVISAVAGSGTATSPFGGTSGATPLVAGAAALLKHAHPERTGQEIKALLMNTAATQIMHKAAYFGGDLAPITRIGGGEVRVAPAISASAAAWDAASSSGSLSFGFQDVTQGAAPLVITRTVVVRNYTDREMIYELENEFRFANDAQNGAVQLTFPAQVITPAHADAHFEVRLSIDGRLLRDWTLNSGALGADGDALTLFEYDGYLRLTDATNPSHSLHLAWQVLPRKGGDISLKAADGVVRIRNRGVATTTVASFALLAVSENLPQGAPGLQNPTPDFSAVGYATYHAPSGLCGAADSFVLAFALNTWERQPHANAPISFELWLDTNGDHEDDYQVLSRDVSYNNVSDGRNVTWVVDLVTGEQNAYFYTDHATNSANTVLPICAEQIGLSLADRLRPIGLRAVANDFYYGGDGDFIAGITFAPFGEQYIGLFERSATTAVSLIERSTDSLRLLNFGPAVGSPAQGLLLLLHNGGALHQEVGRILVTP
ncbi:MAG: S8 family serine peptidase, partial [Chloroflexota bacterium]|nr:S8 family serine peptidase [Chloroflexota bacterium]